MIWKKNGKKSAISIINERIKKCFIVLLIFFHLSCITVWDIFLLEEIDPGDGTYVLQKLSLLDIIVKICCGKIHMVPVHQQNQNSISHGQHNKSM